MQSTPVISDDEFAGWMTAIGLSSADGPFAVAVSGGADSMALAILAARFGITVCLTFDHGLRKASLKEAKTVNSWLAQRGIPHHILTWKGVKPTSDIQDKARIARYKAMQDWCASHNIKYLFLAHHEGDQAETFLMRLMRGSGVDGLAAMTAISDPLYTCKGPKLVRPFLNVGKDRLIATLKAENQKWIEDPSNDDERFLRVKTRQLIADYSEFGLSEERLTATALRMQRVKHLLDKLTEELALKAVAHNPLGFCTLNIQELLLADQEIGLRLLSKILRHYGGGIYPPNLGSIERLYSELQEECFAGSTLAGCIIAQDRKKGRENYICISREEGMIESNATNLSSGEPILWDGRFRIQLLERMQSCRVQKLDQRYWRNLVKCSPKIKRRDIPQTIRNALPCILQGEELIAIPEIYYAEQMERCFHIEFKPFEL